jgi:hypothetical protein
MSDNVHTEQPETNPISCAWADSEFTKQAKIFLEDILGYSSSCCLWEDLEEEHFTSMFGPKYFEDAVTASLRAGIKQEMTTLSSELNSLCNKDTVTMMALTDNCSRHLREDVKTQFWKHLNTLSATTKAECANACKEVVATAKIEVDKAHAECKSAASKKVEDTTLDFLEDIVAL